MRVSLTYIGQPISKSKKRIYLRIRELGVRKEERQQKTISTNIDVENKYWLGSSKLISKKHEEYTSYTKRLNKLYEDIENIVVELELNNEYPHPTIVKELGEKLFSKRKEQTPTRLSYDECWVKFLKKKEIETSFYTHRMYLQLYKRLNDFGKYKKKKMTFEYLVSEDFELEFKKWSWEVRKHRDSFVRKNLGSIKSFMNYCFDSQLIDVKPRVYTKPVVPQKKEVVYLLPDEVRLLHNTTKWDYMDGKEYSKDVILIKDLDRRGRERFYTNKELVKDLMVFMCLSGCRWNDLKTLTWDEMNFNNETFTWLNQKTRKYTTIPLDEMGISILKKYGKNKSREMKLFPQYSNQKFNDRIKELLRELNLKRLISMTTTMGSKVIDTNKKPLCDVVSSHSGRRSFIMGLINKGLGYKEIMSFSGHSDIKSLMKYISFDDKSVERGRNLFIEQDSSEGELVRLFQSLEPTKQELVLHMIKNMV